MSPVDGEINIENDEEHDESTSDDEENPGKKKTKPTLTLDSIGTKGDGKGVDNPTGRFNKRSTKKKAAKDEADQAKAEVMARQAKALAATAANTNTGHDGATSSGGLPTLPE